MASIPQITRTITAVSFRTPTKVCIYGERVTIVKKRRYSVGNPQDHKQFLPDCENKSCKKPQKLSIWSSLIRKKQPEKPKEEDDGGEKCCIPSSILKIQGDIVQTMGPAFIIERDMEIGQRKDLTKEEENLKIIQANMNQKENALDPLPHFTTVEQRMLDLNAKGLHPFYKQYLNVSRKPTKLPLPEKPGYRTRSGPIHPDDIPLRLKYNKKLLETKNIYSDYKRVEPPKQMISRMIEMKQNEKPTIQKRMPVVPRDAQDVTKERTVFDTLYQKQIKF